MFNFFSGYLQGNPSKLLEDCLFLKHTGCTDLQLAIRWSFQKVEGFLFWFGLVLFICLRVFWLLLLALLLLLFLPAKYSNTSQFRLFLKDLLSLKSMKNFPLISACLDQIQSSDIFKRSPSAVKKIGGFEGS